MKRITSKLILLNFLIAVVAVPASAQNSAVTVRIDTYRAADHSTLMAIKPQIMQSIQSLQGKIAEVKLNESYERSYGRSSDQLSLAEGRGNASEVGYYKKNSEYYKEVLRKDPRKIVISYASPFKDFTFLSGVLNYFGVEPSAEEKASVQKRHAKEAGYQAAQVMRHALIEAVNTAAGQVILAEQDVVVQNVRGAYNEVLVSIGSGQINK